MTSSVGSFPAHRTTSRYGRFYGDVDTRWLPDGRRMRLLSSVVFYDDIGLRWVAERGLEVDGASVPPGSSGASRGRTRGAIVARRPSTTRTARVSCAPRGSFTGRSVR